MDHTNGSRGRKRRVGEKKDMWALGQRCCITKHAHTHGRGSVFRGTSSENAGRRVLRQHLGIHVTLPHSLERTESDLISQE